MAIFDIHFHLSYGTFILQQKELRSNKFFQLPIFDKYNCFLSIFYLYNWRRVNLNHGIDVKFIFLTGLQIGSTKTKLENIESLDTLLSKEILNKSKYLRRL